MAPILRGACSCCVPRCSRQRCFSMPRCLWCPHHCQICSASRSLLAPVPLIPVNETERLVALLQQAGATVTTYWHNGGHEVSHGEVSAAREWLALLIESRGVV